MTAAPPEEQDLLHWRISPRAFFWRCVALAVLTMLFTLPLLIWLDPITWLLASVLIAACSIAKSDIWETTKVNLPFIGALLALLLISTYLPAISLLPVRLIYGG